MGGGGGGITAQHFNIIRYLALLKSKGLDAGHSTRGGEEEDEEEGDSTG